MVWNPSCNRCHCRGNIGDVALLSGEVRAKFAPGAYGTGAPWYCLVVAGLNLALSQLPVGNKEGWSLDEKQTVGGTDAATEPTWMFLRRVCVRPDS